MCGQGCINALLRFCASTAKCVKAPQSASFRNRIRGGERRSLPEESPSWSRGKFRLSSWEHPSPPCGGRWIAKTRLSKTEGESVCVIRALFFYSSALSFRQTYVCHLSLRFGHFSGLTVHRTVIQYLEDASLPPGWRFIFQRGHLDPQRLRVGDPSGGVGRFPILSAISG